MARDGSAKAKKQKWADWLNARLSASGWNAADLVAASRDVLVYNTVYNWTKAMARVEAETCVIVAIALNVDASEALNAASYPVLADAFAGKELRLVGTPAEPPDPGLMKILAAKELSDEVKAVMIRWWKDRLAEDEARRIADAGRMIEMRQDSA